MQIKKMTMAGLKPTAVTPTPGVISPKNNNTAAPTRVGTQAVVKSPKPKKMGQVTDKPSQFYKSEDFPKIKHPSIQKLRSFLEKQRSKKNK